MKTRPNRSDPWRGPGSAFQPPEGPTNDSDLFAPVDLRGTGLRGFVEQELQAQSATADSGTNTTLIPGKVYLRKLRDGSWELLVYRGRCTYDCYPSESRDDLLKLAETLQ